MTSQFPPKTEHLVTSFNLMECSCKVLHVQADAFKFMNAYHALLEKLDKNKQVMTFVTNWIISLWCELLRWEVGFTFESVCSTQRGRRSGEWSQQVGAARFWVEINLEIWCDTKHLATCTTASRQNISHHLNEFIKHLKSVWFHKTMQVACSKLIG